ncbi:MAG: class I adenylate-forming enzyme family protein [Phycisphaerae bacterium]
MLVETLLRAQSQWPSKLAVDDGIRSLTYRRLALLAQVLRDVIRRETQGNRVGIMVPASGAFPGLLYGTFWAGKAAVPLNFLLNAGELGPIIEDAGLDLVITIKHFSDIAAKLPARCLFLEELSLRRKIFGRMLSRPPGPPTVDPDDTAVLLYTSGTTGSPKGVQLTYANLHSNCVDTRHSLDLDANQTFLNILPPFHVFGVTAMVLLPVMLGATVYAIPRFSPVALVKAVQTCGVTVLVAIPSMYAAVLKTKSTPPDTFENIYMAISGGEPLPDNVRDGFAQRFGVKLHEGYGLTETSPVISANTRAAHKDGSVGKPVRNVRVRIVGEHGESCSPEQPGEILVQSPGIMKGYLNKPAETNEVMTADGWFRTGDIGVMDEDGFLYITSRKKEMLIIGGENVFPREIEAVLENHAGVLQAAVIGIPDELRGEAPVAFVSPVAGETVSEQELRTFAKHSLAGFKVPKRIVIREDLPAGPTGKILKRRLYELL